MFRSSEFSPHLMASGLAHVGLALALWWAAQQSTPAWSTAGPRLDFEVISAPSSSTLVKKPQPRPAEKVVSTSTPALSSSASAQVEATPEGPATNSVQTTESAGGPSSGENGVSEEYVLTVMKTLHAKRSYPELARKLRHQGQVLLRFRVGRDGQILESEILKKAPYESLNQSARRLIEEVRRFEKFPDHVKEATWAFTVPVEYRL